MPNDAQSSLAGPTHNPPGEPERIRGISRYLTARSWALVTFVLLCVLGAAGIQRPAWGDELHFAETIRLFVHAPAIRTLLEYPEVTPPMTYVLYAVWASAFGVSLAALRIFSIILALATWNLLFAFFQKITGSSERAWCLSLVVLLNPYALGTSVFVFTDVPALFFLLAGAWAVLDDRPFLYGFASAAALCCRQYAIILPLSVVVRELLRWNDGGRRDRRFLLASAASLLPLSVLMAFWGGIAPRPGIERWVAANPSLFNLHAITTYLAFGALYSFPVLVWSFLHRTFGRRDIPVLSAGLIWFILIPVIPSAVTVQQTRFDTVGLAHRGIAFVVGAGIPTQVVLAVFFLAGLLMTSDIARDVLRGDATPRRSGMAFASVMWLAFLLIMPFSFQVWEKYLLLVLPFLLAALYFLRVNEPEWVSLEA
jgi:4-amino-4-deoxy-L-arabinose transferase-like glycosyltransferase